MTQYFFDITKKTIVAVAKQFVNMSYTRKNGQNIPVALTYAEKSKFYKRLNDNRNGQGMTLPAIAIYNSDFDYLADRQQNNLTESIVKFEKENKDIMQFIGNPSPILMPFEVTIKTKYYEDMRYLFETIIPQYQPTKYVSVQLIPEMNLSLNIPITLTNIEKNFELEFEESPDPEDDFEMVLSFNVLSYIFPPILRRYVINTISAYTDGLRLDITDQYSPSALINDELATFSDYDIQQVKIIEIPATTVDRYNYVLVDDITAELTTFGETLQIEDEEGNGLDFVFEYDNGELYSADEYIPSGIATNKTGNVLIGVDFIEENKKKTIYMKTHHSINYNFAYNVLPIYEDFNIRTYKRLDIVDKTANDLVYINDGDLFTLSVGTDIDSITKVYPQHSLKGAKTIEIGITSIPDEANIYLCGIGDEEGDYIYIRRLTTNSFGVYTYISSTETLVATLNAVASVTEFTFTYDAVNWTVAAGGDSQSFTGADYISPFVCNNGTTLARYNYIKGY
jgi:hypothetical protein